MDHQINLSGLMRFSELNKYITDRSMDSILYGRLISCGHNDEWSYEVWPGISANNYGV